jgi:hypothetical protein
MLVRSFSTWSDELSLIVFSKVSVYVIRKEQTVRQFNKVETGAHLSSHVC